MWLLTPKHGQRMSELHSRHKQDLTSWTLFTVILPLITFLFVAAINILYTNCLCSSWGKIFNNGSLPIIAFGVISSTIPYLVEKLRSESNEKLDVDNNVEIFDLRKRALAFATVLLFITAGLFIVQSLNFVENNDTKNIIFLISAIIITFLSAIVGRAMFLLQSVYVANEGFEESVEANVEQIQASIKSQFDIYGDEG